MNINNLKTTYDINSSCPPFRTVVSHDCDVNTRTVEVCFRQGMIPLAISKDCTAKAIFVERGTNILINDNVPCTITDSGSVLIPVDDLHRQGRFDMDIEVTITNPDGNRVIATPFPMWITVNASILNNAEISEESKGTVPELLKEATEALAEAKDYENLDNLPAINGHELVGNKTGDSLGLQNKLTAGENISINANGEISATGGVTSYNDLTDKPTINGYTIGNLQANGLDYRQFNSYGLLSVDGARVLNCLSSLSDNIYNSPSLFGFQNQDLKPIQLPNDASGVIFQFRNDRSFYDEHGQYKTQILKHNIFFSTETGEIFLKLSSQIHDEEPNIGQWQQIGGGSEIVSGVVNQNGTITFTMSDGSTVTTTGESVIGPQGDDYVLTPQDKTDIANIVLQLLPTTQGVLYGNASN